MAKKYIQDFKSKLSNGGTLAPEELQDFFSRLEGDLKDKKYGLVWESQTELVIEQLKTNKVYLEEEQDLKITQVPDNPKSNILIEGDNYEALTYLNKINQKVDVIYIDPPYNTGNEDFVYNDRFTTKEDGFRHSQWVSFMDARLRLARELLTDDGVIFISIDDNEQAQLKLLMDSIYGENNYIGTHIWQNKSGGGQAKYYYKGHEYLHIYGKDKKKVNGLSLSVKEDKRYKNNTIELDGKEYYVNDDFLRKAHGKYKSGVERRLLYEEILEYRDENFLEEVNRKIENKEYILKKYKDTGMSMVCRLEDLEIKRKKAYSIYNDVYTKHGNTELEDLFGMQVFNNPKPVDYIKYLLKLVNKSEATVLDFFAGSGTTGHAVLEINKEDGGSRQFILVTNNENNIAREVTYERNKRVIEGYTTPKGKDVPGIPSNLAYYKTKQVSKYDIDFDEVILQHVIPTIQFTEGVYSRTQHSPHITQLGENVFIFNQYMVEDDEIDTLVDLVKDEDILYIQEGQVDYIKTKLPEGVVYKYLEDVLPTNR